VPPAAASARSSSLIFSPAATTAAVSVSGPIERLTRSPGRLHAAAVVAAGEKISELLRAEAAAGGTRSASAG
jgi:DNA-binding IclR family transcriptional regulator